MKEGLLIILQIYGYILTYKQTIYITRSSKGSYLEALEYSSGLSEFVRKSRRPANGYKN